MNIHFVRFAAQLKLASNVSWNPAFPIRLFGQAVPGPFNQ
jgi:hypothetical protein